MKTATYNLAFYSFLSGLLACVVSICVKYAFNTDLLLESDTNSPSSSSTLVESLLAPRLWLQVAFIALSLLFNSLMWVFYSKSLHLSTNTLYSTALNKFSNFICSALFGYLLFNERLDLVRWLLGLSLLLIGILILSDNNKVDSTTHTAKDAVIQGRQVSARKQD